MSEDRHTLALAIFEANVDEGRSCKFKCYCGELHDAQISTVAQLTHDLKPEVYLIVITDDDGNEYEMPIDADDITFTSPRTKVH